MIKHKKPRWQSLVRIGLVGISALVAEALLPFSPAADTWLLILWLVGFYCAMALWIQHNRHSLEQEPPALDCVGRPIVDNGAPNFTAKPGPQTALREPATRPLNQSEAF